MKSPPSAYEVPTESIFAVIRAELGHFVQHSLFHLDFTNPSLKPIAKGQNTINELNALEKTINDRYLRSCNPETPLHYMTIWTVRSQVAKHRLIETYSKFLRSPQQQTDTQRDAAISYAIGMLQCDTNLMTSPLTRRYIWMIEANFPFPAYVHILQALRKRPLEEHAEHFWTVLSDNYDARRFLKEKDSANPLFKMFSRVVLQAWAAREAVLKVDPMQMPDIVSDIKGKVMELTPNAHDQLMGQPSSVSMSGDDYSMPMNFGFFGDGMPEQGAINMSGQAPMDVDVSQLDWTMIDWNLMNS